jgi:hypothetical protein
MDFTMWPDINLKKIILENLGNLGFENGSRERSLSRHLKLCRSDIQTFPIILEASHQLSAGMSWYGVGNPGKDAEHCNRW